MVMKEKINIAKILKDKPRGTKLYSSACGKCELKEADDKIFKVSFYSSKSGFMIGGEDTFDKNGNLYDDGECIVFPSKEMRDWSKFAWKRGDVLISDCGFVCIFKEWASDDYTRFNGCYFDGMPNAETAKYSKLDNNTAYGYIREIENRCGGKLNIETLEIEKQTEFKDGDVVVTDAVPSLCYSKCIFILKGDFNTGESCANSYIFYNINNNDFCFDVLDTEIRDRNIHLATEEEKLILFDALAKKGKDWDAKKKQVVDLKTKCEFKPMDLCLMKYIGQYNNRGWELCQYAYTEHRVSSSGEQRDFYHAIGGEIYAECIPYKGNEHLLGTKKSK
nr:MAG TPA: hypothetical protein [Caudoviricetes sp.]